jgi:guanylate kinase
MRGLLFVITAPSGAGKSSLIDALLKDDPHLRLSVSYTTRAPRPGEMNGREYHFVDEKTFLAMLERSEFLESAEVHGNRYGTSQAVIREALARGQDLVLEIDWQGAQQVRRLYPDCVGVFILPPSVAELERRLKTRAEDSDDVIHRRMAKASDEMSHWPEYDYVVINHDLDQAFGEVCAILAAERLKRERQTGLSAFVRQLQAGL